MRHNGINAADPEAAGAKLAESHANTVLRRISNSDRLFEVGLKALIRVRDEYLAVRRIFDSRQGFGPRKWTDEQKIEIENGALNRFRYEIERSKIVLDESVTDAFRKIYLYLSELLDEDGHKPSIYVKQIRELDEKLETAIHKMIR